MKAIYGNVPVNKTYSLYETYISDGQVCENCSMIIKNVAVIKSDDNDSYAIGLDCAEALTSIPALEILEAKKQINRKRRFIKALMQSKSIIIDKKHDQFYFWKNSICAEWNSFYNGRGKYSTFKNIIDNLNILITKKPI